MSSSKMDKMQMMMDLNTQLQQLSYPPDSKLHQIRFPHPTTNLKECWTPETMMAPGAPLQTVPSAPLPDTWLSPNIFRPFYSIQDNMREFWYNTKDNDESTPPPYKPMSPAPPPRESHKKRNAMIILLACLLIVILVMIVLVYVRYRKYDLNTEENLFSTTTVAPKYASELSSPLFTNSTSNDNNHNSFKEYMELQFGNLTQRIRDLEKEAGKYKEELISLGSAYQKCKNEEAKLADMVKSASKSTEKPQKDKQIPSYFTTSISPNVDKGARVSTTTPTVPYLTRAPESTTRTTMSPSPGWNIPVAHNDMRPSTTFPPKIATLKPQEATKSHIEAKTKLIENDKSKNAGPLPTKTSYLDEGHNNETKNVDTNDDSQGKNKNTDKIEKPNSHQQWQNDKNNKNPPSGGEKYQHTDDDSSTPFPIGTNMPSNIPTSIPISVTVRSSENYYVVSENAVLPSEVPKVEDQKRDDTENYNGKPSNNETRSPQSDGQKSAAKPTPDGELVPAGNIAGQNGRGIQTNHGNQTKNKRHSGDETPKNSSGEGSYNNGNTVNNSEKGTSSKGDKELDSSNKINDKEQTKNSTRKGKSNQNFDDFSKNHNDPTEQSIAKSPETPKSGNGNADDTSKHYLTPNSEASEQGKTKENDRNTDTNAKNASDAINNPEKGLTPSDGHPPATSGGSTDNDKPSKSQENENGDKDKDGFPNNKNENGLNDGSAKNEDKAKVNTETDKKPPGGSKTNASNDDKNTNEKLDGSKNKGEDKFQNRNEPDEPQNTYKKPKRGKGVDNETLNHPNGTEKEHPENNEKRGGKRNKGKTYDKSNSDYDISSKENDALEHTSIEKTEKHPKKGESNDNSKKKGNEKHDERKSVFDKLPKDPKQGKHNSHEKDGKKSKESDSSSSEEHVRHEKNPKGKEGNSKLGENGKIKPNKNISNDDEESKKKKYSAHWKHYKKNNSSRPVLQSANTGCSLRQKVKFPFLQFNNSCYQNFTELCQNKTGKITNKDTELEKKFQYDTTCLLLLIETERDPVHPATAIMPLGQKEYILSIAGYHSGSFAVLICVEKLILLKIEVEEVGDQANLARIIVSSQTKSKNYEGWTTNVSPVLVKQRGEFSIVVSTHKELYQIYVNNSGKLSHYKYLQHRLNEEEDFSVRKVKFTGAVAVSVLTFEIFNA